MLSLQEILSPIDKSEFFKKYWNKKSLHIPGNKNKFRELFGWNDFNDILSQHRLESPRVRLELGGKSEEDLAFMGSRPARKGGQIPLIDIPVLYGHLKEGATLVLDSLDESNTNVSRLCENITRELGAIAEANSYTAWKNSPGFGLHWDDHDLFVLQLSGKKHWSLYGAEREYPLYRDTNANLEPPTDLLWEGTVSAGDVIYVPRGHWHSAVGMNEPTLHITVGINNPTGIDMLSWLVDELRDEVEYRKDIPRFDGKESIEAYIKQLKGILDREWSEDIYIKYNEFRQATTRQRMHFSLPFGAATNALPSSSFTIRFTGTTHTKICPNVDNPDLIEFNALGRNWVFNKKSKPLLALILSGNDIKYDDLSGISDFSIKELDSTLVALIEQGLIYISEFDDNEI